MNALHTLPVPSAAVALPSAARLASLLDCGPKGRQRLRKLPPVLTLALSIQQCLGRNRSYRGVLAAYGSEQPLRNLPTESAFSQARSRLRTEQIAAAGASLASHFKRLPPSFLGGRRLLAVDSVDFTVEDTPENRAAWTYPSGQKAGCGFPVLGALFSLTLDTGEMTALNIGKWSTHDLRLALEAPAPFEPGAIHVGDRTFGAFIFVASCRRAAADAICRVKAGWAVARNLLRLILGATRLETDGRRLSFKSALEAAERILWRMLAGGNLERLVSERLPVFRSLLFKRRKRPSQPRACKRRKQQYPYLTTDRNRYVEILHVERYRKDA